MDNRILPPIPTPPAQRWREVRLLYLPRAMFVAGIVLVAWMWTDSVAPATMVAEAEVAAAELRATQAGVVASLKVGLHQSVKSGEVVGHLAGANPRLLEATLSVIRAEVGMLSATMQGATDRQRVALEFERMQLDWMGHRVDRAALLGRLQQIEADLVRAEPLRQGGMISEENYTQLKISRDSLAAQLVEKDKLIARLEPVLRQLNASDPQAAGLSADSALAAAIKVQESKLHLAEEQLSPVPIISPIDGVVTAVVRRPGETVMAGDTVLKVTATAPARLTGYLRQPLPFEPKTGMVAEIRTRSLPPKVFATTVTQVGVSLEPVSPTVLAAMHLPATPTPETAVKVELALPSGLVLRPGEHVDVVVR